MKGELRRTSSRDRFGTVRADCYIYRVHLELALLPQWAIEHALEGFTLDLDESIIWLKNRLFARQLFQLDADAGGRPELLRVPARECSNCHTLYLAEKAVELRKIGDNYSHKCSSHCLEVGRVREALSHV